jgi:hypothetical protein
MCVNAEASAGIVERRTQPLFDAHVSQWRSRLSQAQFTSSRSPGAILMIHVSKRELFASRCSILEVICQSAETISLKIRHLMDLTSFVLRVGIGMKFA